MTAPIRCVGRGFHSPMARCRPPPLSPACSRSPRPHGAGPTRMTTRHRIRQARPTQMVSSSIMRRRRNGRAVPPIYRRQRRPVLRRRMGDRTGRNFGHPYPRPVLRRDRRVRPIPADRDQPQRRHRHRNQPCARTGGANSGWGVAFEQRDDASDRRANCAPTSWAQPD